MHSLKYRDVGFTGLEAAIVLIAFVVVAAVFSYVILGAGFYTTQKAQQTVHTSVEQSSTTMDIVGDVYAVRVAGDDPGTVRWINFSVELASGGTPIDFNGVSVVYSNQSILETLQLGSWENSPTSIVPGQWTVDAVDNQQGASNRLLEPGEQFEITAYPMYEIYPGDVINIEIKPPIGSPFTITRNLPAALNDVNELY